MLSRHPHLGQARARRPTRDGARERFGAECVSERDRVRNSHLRRGQTGNRGQPPKKFLQRNVFAAQNIFLADSPALRRQQMPARDVFDIHDVKPGFHVRRHPPIQKIHDDSAGRSRLEVERTDWR